MLLDATLSAQQRLPVPVPPRERGWDQNVRRLADSGQEVEVIAGQRLGSVICRKSALEEHVNHHSERGDYEPMFYAELKGTHGVRRM